MKTFDAILLVLCIIVTGWMIDSFLITHKPFYLIIGLLNFYNAVKILKDLKQ